MARTASVFGSIENETSACIAEGTANYRVIFYQADAWTVSEADLYRFLKVRAGEARLRTLEETSLEIIRNFALASIARITSPSGSKVVTSDVPTRLSASPAGAATDSSAILRHVFG